MIGCFVVFGAKYDGFGFLYVVSSDHFEMYI